MVIASSLLVVAGAGCGLRARDHACYPYLDHLFQGHVPGEVKQKLARERGTRKQVGRYRAPVGYYWRRQREAPLDVKEVRTRLGEYELARCPAAPVGSTAPDVDGGSRLPPPR